jgi:hypothetical protein
MTLAAPAARDSDVAAPRSTAIETMPSFGQEATRMPGGPEMTLERVIERAIEHAVLGDGILSAIDCVVKLEKNGQGGVITIDAKLLHYKEY